MSDALRLLIGTVPLGDNAEVRIMLDSFNGRPRLDLRTWCDYRTGAIDMRGPTKKGVSLPISDLPALSAFVSLAEEKARALGLFAEGGAQRP